MYHIFFIHSSIDGHLGCFHDLAIVSSAAMNTVVHDQSHVYDDVFGEIEGTRQTGSFFAQANMHFFFISAPPPNCVQTLSSSKDQPGH